MLPRLMPTREHLKRIPVWIPSDQSVIYFVTTCCAERRPLFTRHEAVRVALASLLQAAERTTWLVRQVCFMPDHVHLMVSPSKDRDQSLSNVMQRWKASSTQRLHEMGITGPVWQREFFDHLLRSGESLAEKWRYVEMNPVRAGLCAKPSDNPYLGAPEDVLHRM